MYDLDEFINIAKGQIKGLSIKKRISNSKRIAVLYNNGIEIGVSNNKLYCKHREIKVRCIKSYTLYNNDKTKMIAYVSKDSVYTAILYDLTEEYFAKDNEEREFLVGHVGDNKEIILGKEFEYCN